MYLGISNAVDRYGGIRMGRLSKRSRRITLCIGMLCWITSEIHALVDLELRPASQQVDIDDIIDIHIFILSDSQFTQSVSAMEIILAWDASRLKLMGHIDPCISKPCDDNTYLWLRSWFPVDENLDGLNDDCFDGVFCESIPCSSGCPNGVICNDVSGFCMATGVPFNDGDAKYVALSRVGGGENSAQVTPDGLWVTTLKFRATKTGIAEIQILKELGTLSFTRITDGDIAGLDVVGNIGPPVQVAIGGCPPPEVEMVGSRYIAVTPAVSSESVALLISGDPNDDSLSCLSMYVQENGRLGVEPFYQNSELWGLVFIGDKQIIPLSQYQVQTDCSMAFPGLRSESVSVSTTRWGDINQDGATNFSDLLLMIAGAQGKFRDGATLQNMDIFPCIPDGIINDFDLNALQDAVLFLSFPCRTPCQDSIPILDWADFHTCMEGPEITPPVRCAFFDLNYDNVVDLRDVSLFMIRP